jgi:hypothetical protein
MEKISAAVPSELLIRKELGIPEDAEQVLVFAESSHWDPDWLLTSDEYYRLRIRSVLDQALDELQREPGRIFSVECIFFLRMYWERSPGKRERLRELVNEGRLRLTGSGVTTPDTLVPDPEAIIRDYQLGQQWLHDHGMTQEPRLAYLPDDFGHSPALPSLLAALGYDQAAITRIDGMFFPGSDYELPSGFPRPGSSAQLLGRDLKTLDFVWKGPDGAEVLCHWNAFTYGQGDLLGHFGLVRWMGWPLGFPLRSDWNLARRMRQYVRQLAPLSRTPYMLCPIGFDFNGPIPGLVGLLDRCNRNVYPSTGVYAVNAGLDDYLALVDCHRERLPALALDPNPYWMGFYTARPTLKRKAHALGRGLVQAEKLAAVARRQGELSFEPEAELARPWWIAATANHHDFITGTSPDRVYEREQGPWLDEAAASVERVTVRLLAAAPRPPIAPMAPPVDWGLSHGRLVVETNFFELELDEREGGAITHWRDRLTDRPILTGLGNDLISYADSGGLWRMGHEYRGGRLRERARASGERAVIAAHERAGLLTVEVRSHLDGMEITRRLWFRNDSPLIRMRVEGRVKRRRAVMCRFALNLSPLGFTMDAAGGVVSRPLQKHYNPTFWPARNFAHLRDPAGPGLAVYFPGAGAIAATAGGTAEWIALRNAPRERAFGFLPLPAHPAYGGDAGEQVSDYAVRFTPEGGWRGNQLYSGGPRVFNPAWLDPGGPDHQALAESLVRTDNEEVLVAAVKRADRGEGLIVRLANYHGYGVNVGLKLWDKKIGRALLCDARELDREEITVTEDGVALVPLRANIITVRVL